MRDNEQTLAAIDAGIVEAPRDAVLLAFPDSGERRLRIALRKVDDALAEQRLAVAGFRAQLASLQQAVIGLGESAEALNASLGDAAEETTRAQAQASRLQATAEAMARLA